MIKKIKELDTVRKVLLTVIFIAIILVFKLGLKMEINAIFIKNYPNNANDYTLKFTSFINIYQPYIAPYNYGNYYYQKGQYNDAYEKYKEALTHRIPNNRICKVHINASLTLVKLAELESDEQKAIDLLDEADSHLKVCQAVSGDGTASGGGNSQGENSGDNHTGNSDNEIEGDKDNAKQLEDSIKEKKDELGKNISKQPENTGTSNNPSNSNSNTNNPNNTSNASKKIENVEKESVKGSLKRDKTFQEQSYNNRGQYGQETPGSGCIGACW